MIFHTQRVDWRCSPIGRSNAHGKDSAPHNRLTGLASLESVKPKAERPTANRTDRLRPALCPPVRVVDTRRRVGSGLEVRNKN